MLEEIQQAIRIGNYRVTHHADEEMVEDNIELEEIEMSIENGEIIENYPKDFPFPSCLLCGENSKGEPIHSVWSYDGPKQLAILITVYRPNSLKWSEFKKRR